MPVHKSSQNDTDFTPSYHQTLILMFTADEDVKMNDT